MMPVDFLNQCAPNVASSTLTAVINVESANHPLAVHINGAKKATLYPGSLSEAVTIANAAIKQGHSVDLGLMQINSRNLGSLGYSVADMFNPCLNIHAGARILSSDYKQAMITKEAGEPALKAALSAYNTGNFSSGFLNGYLDKYAVFFSSPAPKPSFSFQPTQTTVVTTAESNPYAATTTVYKRSITI